MRKSFSIITRKSRTINVSLRNNLRSGIKLERSLERKSISLKSKLVEDRGRTLIALALRNRQQEKDKTRGVGGALGIIGGGALGRRFFGLGKPRVPRSPAQLLRMQKGTSSLSRVSRAGRLGKLGRIGPLAVLGTGLDFAGRKAEGQTNLQAGIGAGGGLAGALAGAKYGAILGTALGGPIGTLIGGVGGSIIGGLAGGKLADLFTGADKRRKFEEKRVELATKRSLFSYALDDFDRVLDKFEDISLLSIKRARDDDEIPEAPNPMVGFIPKPQTPFIQRPLVKNIGYTAAAAGLTFLTVLFVGSSPGTPEDIALITALKTAVQKSPFLMRMAKLLRFTPTQKPVETLIPGKQIPGLSAKGVRIRAEAILRSLGTFLKKETKKIKTKKIETNVKDSDIQDLIKKGNMKELQELIKKGKTKIDGKKFKSNVERGSGDGLKINKKNVKETPNTSKNIDEFNLFDNQIIKNLKNLGDNLKSDAGGSDDNFIALAPTNNIFLINQGDNNTTIPPMPEGGSTIVIGGGDSNPVDAAYKYAEITTLASTV